MDNTVTVRGIVRGGKTIEVQGEKLDGWLDQEVTLTIKRRRKNRKVLKEMLDEMKEGMALGYVKVERSSLYSNQRIHCGNDGEGIVSTKLGNS
jgi:hypothetical protein